MPNWDAGGTLHRAVEPSIQQMPGCDCPGSRPRVAVIGAGASGLAATKALRAKKINVVTFEQNAHIGGLWRFDPTSESHSSAYRSLHVRTRKSTMEFSDFPMPASFPDYPSASQVTAYLESYAEHFSLHESIRLSTRVLSVVPECDGYWTVTSQARDGTLRTEGFTAVAVTNGAYWQPHIPDTPGLDQFVGRVMHSHAYKEAAPLLNKKVLVVGMGVSGIEISAELLQAGVRVVCSSGRKVEALSPRLAISSSDGMPARPASPMPSSALDIRPAVSRLTAEGAVFADGSSEDFDAVLFCTGYRVSFPFLPRDLEEEATRGTAIVQLYKHMWLPSVRTLAFLGFITTNGSILPLVEAQALWLAAHLAGECALPSRSEMEADIKEWRSVVLEQLHLTYKPTEVTFNSYLAFIYSRLGWLSDPRYKDYSKYL